MSEVRRVRESGSKVHLYQRTPPLQPALRRGVPTSSRWRRLPQPIDTDVHPLNGKKARWQRAPHALRRSCALSDDRRPSPSPLPLALPLALPFVATVLRCMSCLQLQRCAARILVRQGQAGGTGRLCLRVVPHEARRARRQGQAEAVAAALPPGPASVGGCSRRPRWRTSKAPAAEVKARRRKAHTAKFAGPQRALLLSAASGGPDRCASPCACACSGVCALPSAADFGGRRPDEEPPAGRAGACGSLRCAAKESGTDSKRVQDRVEARRFAGRRTFRKGLYKAMNFGHRELIAVKASA